MTIEAWEDYLDPESTGGAKLTEVCRNRLAHVVKSITSKVPAQPPIFDSAYISKFRSDGCPGPSRSQQATNAVRYLGDLIQEAGTPLEQLPTDFFAHIGAPSPDSAAKLVLELIERQLLTGIDASSKDGAAVLNIDLTLDGWDRYEEERRGRVAGNYGFIALQFNDEALETLVRDVVKPAVKEGIGYDLVDMRDVARAGVIDNIMRAQIRDAAFVIADLTHDNFGAYWEAGYAEGLDKPVIYICEKTKFDEAKTHFDTNHCTTVVWSADKPEDFKNDLVATLRRSLNLFPVS